MNKLSIFTLLSFFAINLLHAQDNPKDELFDILKNRPFNENSLEGLKTSVMYKNKLFKVDPETGFFYRETSSGFKKPLELQWDGLSGVILDHKKPIYKLYRLPDLKLRSFNDIALVQRLRGIYTIKSKNPECYFAYAAARFDTEDPSERLLALERPENPRPLVFKTDADWNEFKEDMKNLFKYFKSDNSYIVILGSSTTFISLNPSKGETQALFIAPPKCISNAKNPDKTKLVGTFDMPDSEPSDVDINILIPEISHLCENVYKDSSDIGNDGTRRVYVENTLADCLAVSKNRAIRNMVKNYGKKSKWPIPGGAFKDFFDKWTERLGNREINFSVRILPDQRKSPIKPPDAEDNFEKELASERFVIPIN